MQLAIRSLRVRGINLALARPVETASGVMRTTPLALLDVLTEDGIAGVSYVRCYTPTALGPLIQLIANLEDVLRGKEAHPGVIFPLLDRHFKLLGPQGLTGIAMAAIDMALWDAQAKAAEVPLVTLLGGTPASVPAYASLRTMAPEAAAAEAAGHVAFGFRAVKLKIGVGGLSEDLKAIRAVRAAVGDDVDLLVDYNQSLTLEDALERVRALDAENLYWIEEPLRADDFAGHAKVSAAARTPVQLGENWWGPADMEKSVAAHASDHVMLDVMKLYGVTGWLRAAAIAAQNGLPASSHTFPEISAHLMCVTPTARYLEYLDHAGPILQQPVEIRDGRAYVSTAPGAGIAWNEEVLRTQDFI